MSNAPSDFDLLDRWRAGDVPAGNQLFRRHFAPICRFFRNKVRDGVDDLIQRTFLACVESRDAFRGDASFRTYLFTVARHELYAHLRRRSHVPLDTQTMAVSEVAPSPTGALARKREHKQLLHALRAIPLDFQIALELHYWEELPASQLAAILEIPEGTARSRIRRGKALLQEQLKVLAAAGEDVETTLAGLESWARSLRECVDEDVNARKT